MGRRREGDEGVEGTNGIGQEEGKKSDEEEKGRD